MDDLDRSIARRTARNPECPKLLEAEVRRQQLIGELVAMRIANRLTQADVAREMGVTQSVVAEIESARVDVRFTTLDRYASAATRNAAHLTIARGVARRASTRARSR